MFGFITVHVWGRTQAVKKLTANKTPFKSSLLKENMHLWEDSWSVFIAAWALILSFYFLFDAEGEKELAALLILFLSFSLPFSVAAPTNATSDGLI